VDQADEVELVDMSPQALRQRIRHGNVYPKERGEQALHSFFREGNLNALRELALRRVATAVEEDLEAYMREHHIEAAWPAGERVMACVDARPDAQRVLRRAWRMANRLQADLLAVFVETPGWANASPEDRRALEENLRFAEDLGAQIIRAAGSDIAKELVRVAREKNAGRIVIGHPRRRGLSLLLRSSTAAKLLRLATDVDVQVVAAAKDL
jgi:two-component system sensor histidine kinase KdpD